MAIAEIFVPLTLISLALFVSIGYIITRFFAATIETWQSVFWVSTLIPLLLLSVKAYTANRANILSCRSFSPRIALPLVVPLLVLAPGLYVLNSSPTMQVLSHPDLHFGYINQVLHNSTPFESVFLAGHPATYYWLFHAYIGTLVEITSLRAPVVATVVNITAMFLSFHVDR